LRKSLIKITAIEDIHLYYPYPDENQFRYGGGLCTGRLSCLIRVHTDVGITGIANDLITDKSSS